MIIILGELWLLRVIFILGELCMLIMIIIIYIIFIVIFYEMNLLYIGIL